MLQHLWYHVGVSEDLEFLWEASYTEDYSIFALMSPIYGSYHVSHRIRRSNANSESPRAANQGFVCFVDLSHAQAFSSQSTAGVSQ